MERRSFLKAVGAGTGALAGLSDRGILSSGIAAEATETGLPRRDLGRTGEKLSIVGFPGLSLIHDEQARCTEALHQAFDRGVNYFDVAPAYGNGDAEIKMGQGLVGVPRDRIFLSCKTKMRDKARCRKELERSLTRLKTDHFDLYQLHCLKTPEEVAQALGPDGAMETILKARDEGKLRFVGFSAHTTKAALKALNEFAFDTVMFPINFVEYFTLGFGKPVLDLAAEKGAAVLAIKPLCRGAWPKDMERTRRWWYRPVEDQEEIDLALRFTLSQQPVVTGIPPAFLDIAERAFEAGRRFRPITAEETETLRQLAARCESIFRREEMAVAFGTDGRHRIVHPDSPHEGCPGCIS